jgi:hypothetical protein
MKQIQGFTRSLLSGFTAPNLGVMAMIILLLAVPFESGCSATTVAQDIVNWTPTIVSTAQTVASTVAILAPQDAVIIGTATAGFTVAADTLANQAKAYRANPGQTTLQALQTQVTTLQQSVNAAMLQAVKITNPQSQQQIIVAIQALSVGVNAVLALVASLKGNTVAASASAVKIAQIEPYLDRNLTVQMVAAHYADPRFVAVYQVDRAQSELVAAGF